MQREPKIEALLNAAQTVTVNSFLGLPAVKSNLEHMGAYARDIVLSQANAGMWREWSIEDASQLEGLVCEFALRVPGFLAATAGAAEHPITCTWRFQATALRYLETVGA